MVLPEESLFIVAGDISESLFDSYPVWRRLLYTIVTHYKFDIIIATVIGLNVFFMAIEHYQMSKVSHLSVLLFSLLISWHSRQSKERYDDLFHHLQVGFKQKCSLIN